MKSYFKLLYVLSTMLLVGCSLPENVPSFPQPNVPNSNSRSTPEKTMLSEEQVKAIVLEEVSNGKIVEIDTDFDHNTTNYEIKVIEGNTGYDIEIDAFSGAILKREENPNLAPSSPNTAPIISEEEAKELALQQAPGGQVMNVTYENDPYDPYYNINVTLGNYEYDIEISALSGEVIKNNKDILD